MKTWKALFLWPLAIAALTGCTEPTVTPPDSVVIVYPSAIEDQEPTPAPATPTLPASATITEPAPAVASLSVQAREGGAGSAVVYSAAGASQHHCPGARLAGRVGKF